MGQENSRDISVRPIAILLAESSPAILSDLRREFPEFKTLFDPSYELGKSVENGRSAEASTRRNYALKVFAEKGLDVAEQKIEKIISTLVMRMKRARAVKVSGTIVATLSSAGVISALALSKPN